MSRVGTWRGWHSLEPAQLSEGHASPHTESRGALTLAVPEGASCPPARLLPCGPSPPAGNPGPARWGLSPFRPHTPLQALVLGHPDPGARAHVPTSAPRPPGAPAPPGRAVLAKAPLVPPVPRALGLGAALTHSPRGAALGHQGPPTVRSAPPRSIRRVRAVPTRSGCSQRGRKADPGESLPLSHGSSCPSLSEETKSPPFPTKRIPSPEGQ